MPNVNLGWAILLGIVAPLCWTILAAVYMTWDATRDRLVREERKAAETERQRIRTLLGKVEALTEEAEKRNARSIEARTVLLNWLGRHFAILEPQDKERLTRLMDSP